MGVGFICTTCGVQYPEADQPPTQCAICADERQYVNPNGQSWTTPATLAEQHQLDWRELEPGLYGIGATPQIAIGQRALFVPQPGGGVMWDTTPLVDPEAVARMASLGGVRAIAVSHPHFFAAMVDWSAALGGVKIHLHEDLRRHVPRPSAALQFWSGDRLDLGQGMTLIRCGGHFAGSTVLHWADGAAGKGALFSSDTIMVAADTRWMSFMRSFPNYIPLNRPAVSHILDAVAPYPFERVYGAWWKQVCASDAKARLERSAARYLAAIADDQDIS